MGVFIKICGICSRTDLEQICALRPDAIGFIFWPKAKRFVQPAQVAEWENHIPSTIKKVGVFVEPTAAEVETIAAACQLNVVQIHLTSNDWKMDRPLLHNVDVWLSPRMGRDVTPALLSATQPEPSVFLADAFDPNTIGGTGKLANWSSACQLKAELRKPVLLAGGLCADNVQEAISTVQPWGVDVSSGVEISPGVKDIQKVAEFISTVRSFT